MTVDGFEGAPTLLGEVLSVPYPRHEGARVHIVHNPEPAEGQDEYEVDISNFDASDFREVVGEEAYTDYVRIVDARRGTHYSREFGGQEPRRPHGLKGLLSRFGIVRYS